MQRNVDGNQIVPSVKIRKGRLGWQTPKLTSAEGPTPARSTKTKDQRCPQTLNYQKPQSTQKSTLETQLGKYPTPNKKAIGSRNGKTEL